MKILGVITSDGRALGINELSTIDLNNLRRDINKELNMRETTTVLMTVAMVAGIYMAVNKLGIKNTKKNRDK